MMLLVIFEVIVIMMMVLWDDCSVSYIRDCNLKCRLLANIIDYNITFQYKQGKCNHLTMHTTSQ